MQLQKQVQRSTENSAVKLVSEGEQEGVPKESEPRRAACKKKPDSLTEARFVTTRKKWKRENTPETPVQSHTSKVC